MKNFLRNALFNSFSLFAISQVLDGVRITGGLPTILFGGISLTLLLVLLRPVLNILALPLNIVTLGMFSFLTNVIIFYLLTVFVPGITISSFTFQGVSYSGFVIPPIQFNTLFTFILVSFLQSLIVSFLNWLMSK
jgi:putative membrane protein